MRYCCIKCHKVYNSIDEIKRELPKDKGYLALGVTHTICECGAKDSMRPENFWTKEDKKKIEV